MKTWSFYDPRTGLFAGLAYSGCDDTLGTNTPKDHAAAEGRHDHLSRRVDLEALAFSNQNAAAAHLADFEHRVWRSANGMEEMTEPSPAVSVTATAAHVVDYQPPQPSVDHEWNADTKRWQLGVAAQSKHDGRQSALAQIIALEARQPRAIREAFLGYDGAVARMKDMDAQIVELRKVLS